MTSCTKQQTIDFLRLLIGDADDTMTQLTPDGWEHSPLFVFFHPTLEQAYEGHLRFRQGMNSVIERISKGKDKPNPLPTYVRRVCFRKRLGRKASASPPSRTTGVIR